MSNPNICTLILDDLKFEKPIRHRDKYSRLLNIYQSRSGEQPSRNKLANLTGYSPALVGNFLRSLPDHVPATRWDVKPDYNKKPGKYSKIEVMEAAYVFSTFKDGHAPSGNKLVELTGFSNKIVSNFLWSREQANPGQANQNRQASAFARLQVEYDRYLSSHSGKKPSRNKLAELAVASKNTASKFLKSLP